MPVISTSVSGVSTALNITVAGNYFLTAPTVLEATHDAAVRIQGGLGRVGFTVAGTVLPGITFYGIYNANSGSSDALYINVLASGYVGGGGILFASSATSLTNAGVLVGTDIGILTSNFNDQILNTGTISVSNAEENTALMLIDGNDSVVNAGQIFGKIDLGSGNDSLYGGGGSITGDIDLGDNNDLIDLRHAQVNGNIIGGKGDDVFIVDDGMFSLVEAVSEGTDLVKSTASFELGDNFEKLQLLGAADLNGTGNSMANDLTGNAGDNRLDGNGGSDRLFGRAGDDRLIGDGGHDRLSAGSGNDLLYGGSGNDTMIGETGADTLYGGIGRDVMTGDVGASGGYDDVFVFTKVTDSLNNALSDSIIDFKIGEDRISLSAIDAKSGTVANDAFSFITTAFTNVAGQLRLQTSGANTHVLGDVNGDGVADFRVILTGNLALTATDFIL